MTDRIKAVLSYIDAHRDEYVALLQRFCQQPSFANTGEGIEEMAGMVQKELERLNAQPERFETGGSPFIYGHIEGDIDRTFGFYDHYDVQPVDPLNLWNTDPFSAEIIDGVIYARGVADNKDGLVCRLCAVDAWQKVYGHLPLNVKFLFEGEEEIGSPHLLAWADAHRDLIQADGYVWEGGTTEEGGIPEIDMGVKGLLYLELHARTAKSDAHSMYAAIADNAIWRLVWALSTIKGENGDILIDNFYDDIPPISDYEMEALKTDTFNEENAKRVIGIDRFTDNISGESLLTRLYYKPTCNIAGISGGYEAPGCKTVLPAYALAKIDFRLVPGLDGMKVVELLRKHLDRRGFEDIEIKVLSYCKPHRSDPKTPFCKAAIKTLELVFNKPVCIHCSSAGTSPMYAFCADSKIPAAMFGASSESANIHAPNEHLSINAFMNMIKVTAVMMELFAEQE